MRITVFGAVGNIGSRVVNEAIARGHEVTAVSRDSSKLNGLDPRVKVATGDINNVEDVIRLTKGQDLVVSATRPPQGHEYQLIDITQSLLAGVEKSNVKLLLVGGAACLTVPNSNGRLVVDDPNYVQDAWKAIALACIEQYQLCVNNPNTQWTYMSPPAFIQPGQRTGDYRHHGNELVIDEEGKSHISLEDFAVALLDEVETPQYANQKFTVGY